MKSMRKLYLFLTALLAALCVQAAPDNSTAMTTTSTKDARVLIHTTMGDITVKLYGDTPLHRDNFLRLAREGYYDGVLFHRVIKNFMIQTGDPDSKTAAPGAMLGSGGPGYKIDAEIVYPRHFHKRGALAAARTGDNVNPERRSSGSQFYIVTGNVYSEGQMKSLEHNLEMQNLQNIFNNLAREHNDTIMAMRRNRDREGLMALQEKLAAEAEKIGAENPVKLTPEQIEVYTTIGGAPHLDGTYTVFGEVTEGLDVVEKIENVPTGSADRPTEDVKITSMEILDE